MPGSAAKVIITERQQEILIKFSRSRTQALRLRQRAAIILLAFEGRRNEEISELVGLSRLHVGKWRHRWAESFDKLVVIECVEGMTALRRAIRSVLDDARRSGSPGKFTAEQLTHVVAIACERPEDCGRPITHWTPKELADELQKRKVVDSISSRHVGRLLGDAELKPHRSHYWLNTKEKDAEAFAEQVRTICQCYLAAPRLATETGAHTVSIDEMTGIQALERIAPTKPTRPGKVERREFEYERHGTQTLIGNFDIVTGNVLSPTVQATRTEEDFVAHVKRLVESDPKADWILVMDQLNIHQSEGLVRYIAEACGIDEDLGKKGKCEILQSMQTRQAFLSDTSHRIRIVYTPKHTSWMNQIEIWFSILVRRVLKRGNFSSVEDLRWRILDYIEYFNETLAKPFRWTFTGRPLTAGVA